MNNELENVEHNERQNRFEMKVEGGTAVAAYSREGNSITFTHTEVPQESEGKGVGSAIAKSALDYARDQKLEVVPMCAFIAAYIRGHHEYASLVPDEHKDRIA
jgi:uncharacterized protein